MKRSITLLILLVTFFGYAQQSSVIVENYGAVYKVEDPDLKFETDQKYNAVFDIYTDSEDITKTNKLLDGVARYINMHSEQGVPKENMNIAVILHGTATKDVLNNNAYKRFFKSENPNIELINKLIDANVKVYVCGQSYTGNAYGKEDKLPKVRMAISAMTALVMYQSEGYQIINFN